MLSSARQAASHGQALDRIAEWTRERFGLPEDCAILVSEVKCPLPGCPPLETVVAFWTRDATRHHFKVFKPAADVVADDLPYYWLMKSLAVHPDFSSDCC